MRSAFIVFLIAVFVTSCSNFSTHIVNKNKKPPIENNEPIYTFFKNHCELPDSAEYIGDFSINFKFNGVNLPTEREMISVLEDDVKQNGGNFVMIDEVGNTSNSDVFSGEIYLVSDFAKTNYNEKSIKKELEDKQPKPLEGIYEYEFLSPYTQVLVTLRFGILQVSESKYQMIYLSGFRNVNFLVGLTEPNRLWKRGDIYGYINTTERENLYEAQMYEINKCLNLNGTAKIDNKNLRIFSNDKLRTYMKVYPDSGSYEVPKSSLTGFALDDKNILTCNHGITDDELVIFVKGINGDFNKKYEAVVVSQNKQLDLAVIRLVDSTVKLNNIAFAKSEEEKSISEKVFVLGYPMSNMMGDDIKLTDGLVSSTTGIGGNLKQYQISAPIQPGNSGSPCFDDKGNFIGVVTSKITLADNVGYTLKSRYVEKFLEEQGILFESTSEGLLNELPLVSKVKQLKKSIYLIELTDTEPLKSNKRIDKHKRRRRE